MQPLEVSGLLESIDIKSNKRFCYLETKSVIQIGMVTTQYDVFNCDCLAAFFHLFRWIMGR